jgi:hypothetical protein
MSPPPPSLSPANTPILMGKKVNLSNKNNNIKIKHVDINEKDKININMGKIENDFAAERRKKVVALRNKAINKWVEDD